MPFFKSKRESFEREFGKIVYPKPDPKVNIKLIIVVLLGLLTVLIRSNKDIQIDIDIVVENLSLILVVGVSLFFTLIAGPIHGRYLTTKGVLIKSSVFKKDVFISWEDITKVEITEGWESIQFYDIEGKKYGFNYSPGRYSKGNILFGPFMECLKKFRPDLKETYVKYDYQDAIKQIKEEIRAKPWVVVLGVIIIILILVVSSID